MPRVEVSPGDDGVHLVREGVVQMVLSWPEANQLQDDLRQTCVAAGVTMRGL